MSVTGPNQVQFVNLQRARSAGEPVYGQLVTDTVIKLPGAIPFSETRPDSDGKFIAGAGYVTGGLGEAGDGVLVRLGLDIGGSGVVTFTLNPPPASDYASSAGIHPVTLVSAQLAINQDCSQ